MLYRTSDLDSFFGKTYTADCFPDIIRVIKSVIMGWTRHEECMEEINTYTIFNQETLLKDNIKMGQKKWCMRMWTELN